MNKAAVELLTSSDLPRSAPNFNSQPANPDVARHKKSIRTVLLKLKIANLKMDLAQASLLIRRDEYTSLREQAQETMEEARKVLKVILQERPALRDAVITEMERSASKRARALLDLIS